MVNWIAVASLRATSIMARLNRSLSALFADRYRPELHYMRGPGPKWREKHQGTSGRTLAPADNRELAPAVPA